MSITQTPFGQTRSGQPVTAYRLTNAAGASLTLLSYGATIQSLCVPNASGGLTDVVLGYDTLEEYESNDGCVGATVGRMCNRIGGAAFRLNGQTYLLAKNDGDNHLHGGLQGFDKHLWDITPKGEDTLVASRLSPDGEEGYPGNLAVQVTFTLTAENALSIQYDADTDQDTVVNLTNHSYFNLNGGGSVLGHTLQVSSTRFTENGPGCLPTGRLLDVAGTPFDFQAPKPLGQDLDHPCRQLQQAGGYDHTFALSGRRAALLQGDVSGIVLTVETDLPGVQVYSSNGLTPRRGKGGALLGPRSAVCLETQLFPNAMNCYGFPSPVLQAGQHLHTRTLFAFRAL